MNGISDLKKRKPKKAPLVKNPIDPIAHAWQLIHRRPLPPALEKP